MDQSYLERAAKMADWVRGFPSPDHPLVTSEAVLGALARTPRHMFIGIDDPELAYATAEVRTPQLPDHQPVSQAPMVGVLADWVGAGPGQRILEVGTGSGYQAAVMAEAGADVWSVEVRREVARVGEQRLRNAGYIRVNLRVGDGLKGWPDAAPFDGVVITAGVTKVPAALVRQVVRGGRLVVPMRSPHAEAEVRLVAYEVHGEDLREMHSMECFFIPAVETG